MLERRLAMSERANPTNDAGLVLGDDGIVYEVASDGTRTAIGGGGSSALLQHDFALTAAQIKASVETPAIIIPAPGANKMIAPVNVVFTLAFHGLAYQDGRMNLRVGDTDLGLYTTFLDQAQDFVAWAISAVTAATWEGAARADFVNQPLRIQAALSGSIVTSALQSGGAGGYAVGDTGTVDFGSPLASYVVNSVDGDGHVVTYTIASPGDGYNASNDWSTTPGGGQPGAGSGFSININSVDASGAAGDSTLSGSAFYVVADV